ncbi:SDR family NAD(P)-dependent oxidoreductase [Novosphingobium sp.]|uniref:SDR family NAD(P)-dependent oxidoreductase n=1 Tax=Novosphingobium sp. TaxID=1874826 RepID=UPI003BAB667B
MPRSVVITGGFGALGTHVSRAFLALGDYVSRVDVAPSSAIPLVGGRDFPGVDLTDDEACARTVAAIVSAFGGIDVLINVAGGFVWETLDGGSSASWQRMFAMNVLTTGMMTKAALPALLESPAGRVINVGANAAVHSEAGMGAYAAAKAGVHRQTESLAAELVATRVTVNAVLPSIIDTPGIRAAMPAADTSQWVEPEAIADVMVFLASPAGRSISGALIPVTRGTDSSVRG